MYYWDIQYVYIELINYIIIYMEVMNKKMIFSLMKTT